jgi:probable phosphoglycerate mutase
MLWYNSNGDSSVMSTTYLLLIRHALNDYVREQRLAGWTPGIHLNEEGQAQALALAERLAGLPLAAIYASPLERAVETAQPLADKLGLAVQLCEGVGELRIGEWTGRLLKELEKEEMWPVVQVYPSGARFPGGESMRETQARVVAALDEIRERHPGQTVAVVSHADPIKLAVAHYTGLHLDLFQRLSVSPASVTALAFHRFGPQLVVLNHTDSLPSFAVENKQDNKNGEGPEEPGKAKEEE